MKSGRRLALPVVLGLLVATPVALAMAVDPFGPVEVVDPGGRPGELIYGAPLIGVDGAGNALWAGYARDSESGDDQMAVFERCGTTWVRSLLGSPQENWLGMGLEVAPDGTAMAVWRGDDAGGAGTFYSAVRPPSGAWGAPQVIVAQDGLSSLQFELADNGTAVAVWADGDGTHASFRPAGGAWGARQTVVSTALRHDVALSPAGDAVLLYQGSTPGYAFSKYRPAGGSWGAAVEVLENSYQNTMQSLLVEFDGAGRTVAFADFRELNDTIRVNVGTGGGWGPTDQVLEDAEPPSPPFDLRGPVALVRHPQGAVAVWTRRSTSSNFNDDVVVSRLIGGTWETPKVFDAPNRYTNASVATNAAGEIVLAAGLNHGTGGGVDDIHVATAPSIGGAWSAMARVSPEGTAATDYRTAVAGGGGTAFYVAWGVHGTGDRTEIVTTKTSGTCGNPTATPTPTPSATPEPTPNPLPIPSAPPAPAPTPPAPRTPSAIADFTTLPAANRCVRGRKLTLRFKRPPKGYVVKTVKVRVNAKRVATLKGRQLKKPYYLRKLPRGTFTVTISITLEKGKGLTERRRYTACK